MIDLPAQALVYQLLGWTGVKWIVLLMDSLVDSLMERQGSQDTARPHRASYRGLLVRAVVVGPTHHAKVSQLRLWFLFQVRD
jgi:hypothetical protein